MTQYWFQLRLAAQNYMWTFSKYAHASTTLNPLEIINVVIVANWCMEERINSLPSIL